MNNLTKAFPALALLGTSLLSANSFAGWANETLGGTNTRVYTPSSVSPAGGQRGLMVVLHGCAQANSVYEGANLEEAAENWGLVIALPQGNNLGGLSGDCWKYWSNSGQAYSRTTGDYKRVMDLTKEIRDDAAYDVDPNQIYIAGLSSGAAFANTLGCLAPDLYAGMGIAAGPSIGTTDGGALGSFESGDVAGRCVDYAGSYSSYLNTQIANFAHGDGDYTVVQQYLDQNVDGFADIYGVSVTQPATNITVDGKSINETIYGNGRLVRHKMAGVGHAWPGGSGASGAYITASWANYGNILGEYFLNNNMRIGDDPIDPEDPVDSEDPQEPGNGECPAVTGTGSELAAQGLARVDYNILTYATADDTYLGLNTNTYTLYAGSGGFGYLEDPKNCFGDGDDNNTEAGSLQSYRMEAKSYSGSKARDYRVYTPASYDGSVAVPMIMVLHGCAMDHNDGIDAYNFDRIADENNVIVVFPFITTYTGSRSENCWGYWFPAEIHEGAGEVEDLRSLAMEVESNYSIDANRRYLTGLSSGGAMSVIGGVAHNEYWAAIAAVRGLAYGDSSTSVTADQFNITATQHASYISAELNDSRKIPMMVISSTTDEVVRHQAGLLIRDSYFIAFGVDSQADGAPVDCTHEGVSCIEESYNDANGNEVLRTRFIDGITSGPRVGSYGAGHYWSGEDSNPDAWAWNVGPSDTEAVWDFLKDKTFDGTPVDLDADGDGVEDSVDNCPNTPNADQADVNGDGVGDACAPDSDGDGVEDALDNCPNIANSDQLDSDLDGIGDTCPPIEGGDADNDGVVDGADNCPNTANADQLDSDGDGLGNVCDATPYGPDADGDGEPDATDNCPNVANADQLDSDDNGVGDACQAPTLEGSVCATASAHVSAGRAYANAYGSVKAVGSDQTVGSTYDAYNKYEVTETSEGYYESTSYPSTCL